MITKFGNDDRNQILLFSVLHHKMAFTTRINQEQTIGKSLSQASKELLLTIMADKSCRKILEATMDSPKTAIDLSNNCEIPLGTVYRRLRLLTDKKITRISGTVRTDGKKVFLYQSRIQEMNSCFGNNGLTVEIIQNDPNDKIRTNSGSAKVLRRQPRYS